MNIAVIGLGYWGRNHVRVFKELQNEGIVDKLYVCDIERERMGNAITNVNFMHSDYKDLIHSDIDAVSIVTPSNTHYKIAKDFLEAGIDVFVEKPMTLDSKQAEELIKIAERNDCISMPGHIFRFHPAIIELKKRMDNGDFGKIYHLSSQRLSLAPPRKDMGVLFALGIHEVDMFCHLLNKEYPDEVYATRSKHLQQDVEESALLVLSFDNNNTNGYANESWLNSIHGKVRNLEVYGSRGGASVNYLKPNVLQFYNRFISKDLHIHDEGTYTITLEYKEPLKEELKHFVDCVKTRKTPIADMYSGKRAVEMIEIAIKSANEGRVIKIEEEMMK